MRPQAQVLTQDSGIRCVTLDHEWMRGTDDGALRCPGVLTGRPIKNDGLPADTKEIDGIRGPLDAVPRQLRTAERAPR